MPAPQVIDLRHLGRERVIATYVAGEALIDPGPASCLPTLLEALGDQQPRAILLTHVHLDHAGASGSLVQRWPEVEVYVHERGAGHLVDPSRLLNSARRLYGEDLERLWGECLPVPQRRLRTLRGGERLLDGAVEVAYSPGHAWHHVSYLHERTAYVGDVGGVRIAPAPFTMPPTPPPDIDLAAWHDSIERLAAWQPERLAMTHFGTCEDPQNQLEELGARLDSWAELVRRQDREAFAAGVRDEIALEAGREMVEAYVQAASPDQLYEGLERYWRKREGIPAVS